jgi:hypothetical protein
MENMILDGARFATLQSMFHDYDEANWILS